MTSGTQLPARLRSYQWEVYRDVELAHASNRTPLSILKLKRAPEPGPRNRF
ncbi:MAG: hypothetical protein ABWK05_06760 [Pyrobaculum sp.]